MAGAVVWFQTPKPNSETKNNLNSHNTVQEKRQQEKIEKACIKHVYGAHSQVSKWVSK